MTKHPCGYCLRARDVLARDGVLVGELLPGDLEEAGHVVEHREEHGHQDGYLGAAVRYDVLRPGNRKVRKVLCIKIT